MTEQQAKELFAVVKGKSFIDGNKRIAATLFLWFCRTTASSIVRMAAKE